MQDGDKRDYNAQRVQPANQKPKGNKNLILFSH